VLKLVLYPLTHKSFESTTKMQKIQPLLKEVQAKYKHDPKTLNIEMKKLYKEHGVNPMGGCLPMLLQMPVFFALYPILRYSIDLRQASFLWLPDLSEPDPYLILPIAMAIFMFVQQKLMAPSKQSLEEMDEKQKAAMQSQKMMMYVMPVMMFFLFRSFPSGLVLYWTLFNVMSSVQQYFIKKSFHKD
jgi:YidC/Oxa1 family membrane protein insertase